MNRELQYSDVGKDGKDWDLRAEYRLVSFAGTPSQRSERVRIHVHHVVSCVSQSTAVAEVWSTSAHAWNEIATLHYSTWTARRGLDVRRGATRSAWLAHDILLDRAQAVLS